MTVQDLVKQLMKEKTITQSDLASRIGYQSNGGIINALSGKSLRVDTLERMVSAMGCDLIIRDGDRAWVIKSAGVETISFSEIDKKEHGSEVKIDDLEQLIDRKISERFALLLGR